MAILNQEKGFTLIELLATLVILTVVIFSFIAFFTNGYSSIARFGERSEAMHLAKQAIETASLTTTLSTHEMKFVNGSDGIEVKGEILKNTIGSTGKDIVLFVPDPSDWEEGVNYFVGDVVKYGTEKYRCLVDHASSSSIKPNDTTYWQKVILTGG